MARPTILPTGREVTFKEHEVIVSKTDLKGIITYANPVFLQIAGFTEEEVIGQPHNLIRHPDMPRCVFKLLWDVLQSGQEIFAYVVNQCKNGDHYWVFAHVTPTFNELGEIVSYHSNRRVPEQSAIDQIKPIYTLLKQKEDSYSDSREGVRAATELLGQHLAGMGMPYEEFIFTLC